MKAIPVSELTSPPVVGQTYLVPCVRYWWHGKLRWWPVVGPKHEDAEHLSFHQVHYHLDRRFIPPRYFDTPKRIRVVLKGLYLATDPRYSGDIVMAASPLLEYGAGTGHRPDVTDSGGPLPAPVLRRRECFIADTGFPELSRSGEKFVRFHSAYEGRACGRDAEGHLVCPHKGARLSSLAPDREGRVICPLHGLMVNVQTGRVVKRPGGAADVGAGSAP